MSKIIYEREITEDDFKNCYPIRLCDLIINYIRNIYNLRYYDVDIDYINNEFSKYNNKCYFRLNKKEKENK